MKENKSISHVERREIQAPIVIEILKAFIDELGKEEALKVISKVIESDAIKSGKCLAERFGGNSMKELAQLIREVWCEDGAMEIDVLKETDTEFHFDVSKCLYAEVYRKIGNMELGKYLSCNRDFPFNQGFNPDIELRRTKTIMEGKELCDFRYYKK
ncbi:MAG: hypothetical protein C0597_01180 [Marinilabiliales bacterium]|nr:MAG: hypothetical protein C0597_01180 [Marinilabiliales bacterium]